MSNPFDQFDAAPAQQAANPFDQFDAVPQAVGAAQIPDSTPMKPDAAPADVGGQTFNKLPGLLNPVARAVTGAGETGLAAITSALAPFVGVARGEKGAEGGTSGYQPQTAYGKQYTQELADAIQTLGKKINIPGLAQALGGLGGEMGALGHLAAPAALQAPQAIKAAGNAMIPKLSPEVAALAKKAREMGVTLRPDMLTDNKFLRMAGESSENIPFAGGKTEERQTAFNRALIKTIGGDPAAKKLTPDVFDKAMTQSGEKIGEISSKVPVKMDETLSTALDARAEHVSKFETESAAKIVKNYIDEIKSKAKDGSVPGETFRKINSQIGKQIRSTSDGDLKHALGELQEDMHDALQRNLSGEDLAALKAARKQYAVAKTLEPLVAKSKTGDISPAGLMGRATSDSSKKAAMARGKGGDIGDIARIGQQFLKDPNSSGTAERGLLYGALGGGAITNPLATAGAYGAANIYNRLGPKVADWIVRNQK